MKKITALTLSTIGMIVCIACLMFTVSPNAEAYNRTLFDTTYDFDYAEIYSPGGELIASGNVEKWTDWEDSDAIQVKIDGVTYYTHLCNVILESH